MSEATKPATKPECQLCHRVGQNGAMWLVNTSDGKSVRVHKPCGEKLAETAPPALHARLVPSAELKAKWAAERADRQARDFWADKCPQLLELKKDLEHANPAPS